MSRVASRLREVHEASDRHQRRAALAALQDAIRADGVEDPLLAASCAGWVVDVDLREELERVAALAAPRFAEALALVVDADGRGQRLVLRVALVPGASGVWTPMSVRRDAELAAQIAASVALGSELGRWSVRWQLGDGPALVEGASLGLGLAVLIHAARSGLAVPGDLAFTGTVDVSGAVGPVEALARKVDAAAGLRAVVHGGKNAFLGGPTPGIGVATFADAVAVVWPSEAPARRGAWRWPRWPWLLVAPAAAWTAALDPIDAALFHPLVDQLRPEIQPENTVVVEIADGVDLRDARRRWSEVVDGLVASGVSVIVFDLVFGEAHPADEQFADSLRRAREAGVTVISGTRRDAAGRAAALAPTLAAWLTPGLVEIEVDLVSGRARRVPLRAGLGAEATWAMAAQALAHHLHAPEPALRDGELVVGVTHNPAPDGRAWLPPVAEPPRLDIDAPAPWPAAARRVAVIGVGEGRRDWLRTPAGPRAGPSAHAAMIEALARQAALRVSTPGADAIAAAALGASTAWLRRRLPERLRGWSWLPAVAAAVLLAGWVAVGGAAAIASLCVAGAVGRWAGQAASGTGEA